MISTSDLEEMLGLGWRERQTAFWLIAAGRRTELRSRMAQLPDGPLTMVGYGLALARLGTKEDADLLVAYLRVPLGSDMNEDGRSEALAALRHLDNCLGTHRAQPLLDTADRDGPTRAERHAFEQQLALMDGQPSDLRDRFVREGVYAKGLRGWRQPPFM